jgi:uncharacterized protein
MNLTGKFHREIGLMAKYWAAGKVKTRLARDIGDVAAAELHRCFTERLTSQLASTADGRSIFVSPDEACGVMRDALDTRWEAVPQGEGDLGERMTRAFQCLLSHAPKSSVPQAILIGADLPCLTHDDLRNAFDRLNDHDVVLGPADDGGYYLIGVRGQWCSEYQRLLEGIAWSTDQVFSQTMQVIQDVGLTVDTLGMREDIDTLDSLKRLWANPKTDAAILGLLQSQNIKSLIL